MTEHSRLPPSSAARRVACPGSRALEEKYKSKEMSPAAREGEAAHWVAAQLLQEDNLPDFAPNGELITDEMRNGAHLYYIAILDTSGDEFGGLHIEERIDISIIHPDCFGTPDCWFIKENELHIFDYKFGHGYVEVFENWQMISYCAGILNRLYGGDFPNDFDVYFHIVQPRSYHPLGNVRVWKTKVASLYPYFDRLRAAEVEASKPHALTYVSSECHYCAARHVCPSLREAALAASDSAYMNIPQELSSSDLGSELRYLIRAQALLEARITGLSEEATAIIKRGERVPDFTLESAPARLHWGVEIAEVLKLGELLNVDLAKPREAITPRQAIEAGIDEALIEVYCERRRGALKLTPIDPMKARKIFGGDK